MIPPVPHPLGALLGWPQRRIWMLLAGELRHGQVHLWREARV